VVDERFHRLVELPRRGVTFLSAPVVPRGIFSTMADDLHDSLISLSRTAYRSVGVPDRADDDVEATSP